MTFSDGLLLLFIALKLTHHTDMPWWAIAGITFAAALISAFFTTIAQALGD